MDGTRPIAQRIVNAENAFMDQVRERIGCSQDEAAKVLRVYLKVKVARLDPVSGVVNVKHGAFLDADVLRNAIDKF